MKILTVRDGAAEEYPHWMMITVEGMEDVWMVDRDWMNINGELKVGDEVEFQEARVPTYSNCPYKFVSGLRREAVQKETGVEDAYQSRSS